MIEGVTSSDRLRCAPAGSGENLEAKSWTYFALDAAVDCEVATRVSRSQDLTFEDRAVFYSSWHYGVVRLLTSLDEFQTPNAIAKRLGLSVSRVQDVLDFLSSRALVKASAGRFVRTGKNTHVPSGSPLAARHHQNWRARSLQMLETARPDDLSFTAPLSIALRDAGGVRAILLDAISQISKLVESSPAEDVFYLGIDWMALG